MSLRLAQLKVNGVILSDIHDVVRVSGATAQKVTVVKSGAAAVTVWERTANVPTVITDFAATDTLVGEIDCTWTPATNGVTGHDLYVNGALHTADVFSPFKILFTETVTITNTYHVVAHGVEGSTASNQDNGTSLEPPYVGLPSPLVITASTTVTAGTHFPANIAIQVCVVGGGGGGDSDDNSSAYAGYSGAYAKVSKAFPYAYSAVATIGTGGIASCGGGGSGGSGTPSTFDGLSAAGGRSGYYGNGAGHVSPCNGNTYYDGSKSSDAYGGGASPFANGGNGQSAWGASGSGGAGNDGSGCAGNGGAGQIVLSW